jgi:hypothetical protein
MTEYQISVSIRGQFYFRTDWSDDSAQTEKVAKEFIRNERWNVCISRRNNVMLSSKVASDEAVSAVFLLPTPPPWA